MYSVLFVKDVSRSQSYNYKSILKKYFLNTNEIMSHFIRINDFIFTFYQKLGSEIEGFVDKRYHIYYMIKITFLISVSVDIF